MFNIVSQTFAKNGHSNFRLCAVYVLICKVILISDYSILNQYNMLSSTSCAMVNTASNNISGFCTDERGSCK